MKGFFEEVKEQLSEEKLRESGLFFEEVSESEVHEDPENVFKDNSDNSFLDIFDN